MVDSVDGTLKAISDKGFVDLKLNNTPTVLIVDDEDLMREVVTLMVEENGGKTITAVDGLDAVEVFAENKDRIDYVFMDVSMPRMNGYEAYLEIKKIAPQVPVVIVSGLKMLPEIEQLYRSGEVEFLSKPFHEAELLKILHKLEQRDQA